ncbi:MFS transporter [Romeria aff. gracilis LEGE 07310]|uniref:MFS transporter n=1 Tax=Vasconcelosia minhoensis LEGE 07310 TaxID=915328 RepID=A0A8J7ASZ4_9CYAN|nr:MFS transporter [Romeria gracilis]MBE9079860.1 MFS transporter [Romeria aff. gracilis LEGE 07310]
MRTFTLIWFGQLVSTIGSYMTGFALTLWAWDLTGSATALALLGFFSQLPRIPVTLVAGLIVDRFNRKRLMMLGDAIVALSTVGIGVFYLTDSLQLWHLYLAATLSGGFGQIQSLAYQTSISSMVPGRQLTRANGMNSAVHYGAAIVGPAVAGMLYPLVGLLGILLADLATFGIAIATLLYVQIPQPPQQVSAQLETIAAKLTFGFRYVWQQSELRALLLLTTLFWFFHDLGEAIYDPMILARTGGSAQVLASTASAAGIGGVTGAILLSVWGGPRRRIFGMLAGFIGAGLSKTVFGLGRSPLVWVPAQFCSSLNFPLLGSSEIALWMTQIPPERQGRVFAANALVVQGGSAIAALIAGPLADQWLEPAIAPGNHLLSGILGTGSGAGMALLYGFCAVAMVGVGVGGFWLPALRRLEASPTVAEQRIGSDRG